MEIIDIQKLIKLYPWVFLSLVLAFIFLYSLFTIYYPIYIPEPGVSFYIPPKSNLKTIADTLEKQKIIRSAFYFRAYLVITNRHLNIKAGYYNFYGYLNIPRVSEILEKGGKGIVVTIPEGLTLVEINDILNSKGIKIDLKKYKLGDFSEIELLKYFSKDLPLEGFLAPDTYEFFQEESEKEVVYKFLKNFERKFLPEFLKFPEKNFYERLIIASILEREAKFFEDMKIIAGILDNRLKTKKKLEVDATVAYIKCKKYPCDWQVTSKEIRTIDNPYNTYKNYGLPPTPISNPGLNAIKASLEPITTDYLYYLTDKSGKAIFSKTIKEHQANIKKYLKD